MQAVLLRAYGEAPELGEHAEPAAAETLVEVLAAPIVPLDLLCASGSSYFGHQPLPYVPGVQGVGRVLSSPAVASGTRVWFATSAGMAPGDGSMAPLAAVGAGEVVPLTAAVTDAHAAAIGTSGVAAWMALAWRAGLRPGERVVVLGASGVVGQVALAVARHLGAARVVAVCRPGALRPPGADEVVTLDAGQDRRSLTATLRQASGGPVDVVIDPVFGEPAAAAAAALGSGGRLVNLGGAAGDRAELSSASLRSNAIAVLGYTNNAISAAQRATALGQVLGLAERGALQVAHEVRPLGDCATAWVDAGRSGRRIVLDPAGVS